MTRHRMISLDGVLLAVIAGLLIQAIVYNSLGINVADVPVKMILLLWGVFTGIAGVFTEILGI